MKCADTLLWTALLLVCAAGGVSAHFRGPEHRRWFWSVGSSSTSVLPPVNGTTDYWTDVDTAVEPEWSGTFVPQFDHGVIAVGNGKPEAHWVRDDVRVHVAVYDAPRRARDAQQRICLVVLSSETYMLFAPDIEEYQQTVKASVHDDLAVRLRFFIHGQHNHEGPDTSGITGLNRAWYKWQLARMVQVTLEALDNRQPAKLEWARTSHHFGFRDKRDPVLFDEHLRILRAFPVFGGYHHRRVPIVTLVNWAMHPEATLFHATSVPDEDCVALGEQPGCDGEGRFLTGDFPGILHQELRKLYGGGDTVFMNGAIGALTQPWGPVWEVTEEHPLGDGIALPDGAVDLPRNFRRAFLIGRELAKAVFNAPRKGRVHRTHIEWREEQAWIRLASAAFRAGMATQAAVGGDPTIPLRIGYNNRGLFTCPYGADPGADVCISDNLAFEADPVTQVRRVGTHLPVNISYARIGPMRFLTMPGEMAPELVTGLPLDFDQPEAVSKYFLYPEWHVTGANYTMPGSLMSMLQCSDREPCFFFGLTQDETGYMMPISDWQIQCFGKLTGNPAQCAEDHTKGALTYPGAMSGEACKHIMDDLPAQSVALAAQYGVATAEHIVATCTYGLLGFEDAPDNQHYEETNSGSWDLAGAYFDAVSRMLDVPVGGRFRID